MEDVLSSLPNEGEPSEHPDDHNDHDGDDDDDDDERYGVRYSSKTKGPYTHDLSFTSFDEQLRVAREREHQRRRQEKEKMNKSASALLNGSTSSIQERMKKFQIGNSAPLPSPTPSMSKHKIVVSPASSVKSSMSSLNCTEKILSDLQDEKDNDRKVEKVPSEVGDVLTPLTKKPVLSFQEKLKLARERSESNQPKAFKDRMHCSMSAIPSLTVPEEGENEEDDEEAVDFNNSYSNTPCYTGDESFTSFDLQLRIARDRERERRKAEMQEKLGGSTSSIKDRMKMFDKK